MKEQLSEEKEHIEQILIATGASLNEKNAELEQITARIIDTDEKLRSRERMLTLKEQENSSLRMLIVAILLATAVMLSVSLCRLVSTNQ